MMIPSWTYKRLAQGHITEQEVCELESFSSGLYKSASSPPSVRSRLEKIAKLPKAAPMLMQQMYPLLGAAALAPLVGFAAGKGIEGLSSIGSGRRKRRALQKILEVHPDIGTIDDPRVKMAFETLHGLNPEYANDPLIAGPLLQNIVQNRMDPTKPRSGSYIDPAMAKNLSEISKWQAEAKGRTGMKGLSEQMQAGLTGGIMDMGMARSRDIGSRRDLFVTRREADRNL